MLRKEVEEQSDGEALLSSLEELQELIEVHEANSHNLAVSGGLGSLLKLIMCHEEARVRMLCCQIFNQVVQNNTKV